jgi:mRNA interferase HigB
MRVVGREKLDGFCGKHTNVRKWIATWLDEAEGAVWSSPQTIKDRYASASFLAGNTVIFNVKGNEYRLEVVVAYRTGIVTIVWAGTHAEYDQRNTGR